MGKYRVTSKSRGTNGSKDLSGGSSSIRDPLLLPDSPNPSCSYSSVESSPERLRRAHQTTKRRADGMLSSVRRLWKKLRSLRHLFTPQPALIRGTPFSHFDDDWGLLKNLPRESLALSSRKRNVEIERETSCEGEGSNALATPNDEPEPIDGDLGLQLPSESLALPSGERKIDVEREIPWADGDFDWLAASNDESELIVRAQLSALVDDHESLSKLPEDLRSLEREIRKQS